MKHFHLAICSILLLGGLALSAEPTKKSAPYAGHPRLFFDGPAEKNGLLKNMSPARAAIWKNVLATIRAEPKASSGRKYGRALAASALVYGISGDKAYRDGSLVGLRRAMSDASLWAGERLNRAEMLYGLAVAYDCLHDVLPADERLAVRKRLMAECPKAITGDWRVRMLSNQAWVSAAALACACYTCRGEDPEAKKWMKVSREILADHVRFRATDGTPSNEGCQYGSYEGIWGLVHRVVIERGEATRPKVLDDDDASGFARNYSLFWLHANVPGHQQWVDYGDSRTRTNNGHAVSQALAYYAALYRKQNRPLEAGVTEWLRQKRLAACGDPEWFTPYHFLWYQDGIQPISPEGKVPTAGHFRDYELHIFRDSWEDPKATWFAFKCSPQPSHTFWKLDPGGKKWESTGHGHPDTGHFSLVADGQWLAVDDGYGGSTVSQHNTLVIDDQLQLGDKGGGTYSYRPEKFPALARVDAFGEVDSSFGHFLTDDMTAAYPNATFVQRHVLVLRNPMRIVIADVVKGGKQVEWLLHTDKKATVTQLKEAGQVMIGVKNARLLVQTALPAKPTVKIEVERNKTQVVKLGAPVSATPFVVALMPGKAAAKPATIHADGFTFASGETVKWNFAKNAPALCLAEGPNGIVAAQVTRLDRNWISLRSPRPVNLAIDKAGKGMLALPPGGAEVVVKVTVNGKAREYRLKPDSVAVLADGK